MTQRKSLMAYAMLHAAVEDGATNPVHALVPLIERALSGLGGKIVNLTTVQSAIREDWGLEIPINILRYCMGRPILKHLYTHDPEKSQYTIRDTTSYSSAISASEAIVKQQYDIVIKAIRLMSIRESSTRLSPEEIVFQWLDSVSDTFITAMAPPVNLSQQESESNRIVMLCMTEGTSSSSFKQSIIDMALGDILYKSILYASQYETLNEEFDQPGTRLSGVCVYLDTGLIFRLFGYMGEERYNAAQELLQMCRATGCQVAVFDHSVDETKRGLTGVANRLYGGGTAYGPMVSWAVKSGFSKGDLLEEATLVEEKLDGLGIEVHAPPELTEELSISELALDYEIEVGVQQDNPHARVRDVQSVTAVYRLRNGNPVTFENCKAIMVTNNKSLADAVTRYFNREFKNERLDPGMQLCVTDVTFSTRLWTKLPTKIGKAPRSQILSRAVSHLRPNQKLRDNFLSKLEKMVQKGVLSDERAAYIKLTAFADRILAIEYDSRTTDITDAESIEVVKLAIKQIDNLVSSRADKMASAKTSGEVLRIRDETSRELEALRIDAAKKALDLQLAEEENKILTDKINLTYAKALHKNNTHASRYSIVQAVSKYAVLFCLLSFVALTVYSSIYPKSTASSIFTPWIAGLGALFAIAGLIPKGLIRGSKDGDADI